MASEIDRIEVYLDKEGEPRQVLAGPPYRLRLATSGLSDGPHRLRLATRFKDGGRHEQVFGFESRSPPLLGVEGLEEGATVSGDLDLALEPIEAAQPPPGVAWPYLLSALLILGGAWSFFAFSTPSRVFLASVEPSPADAGTSEEADAGTLALEGEKLYAAQCAKCHQADGSGMPGIIPPLAKNPILGDAPMTVKTIVHGLSGPLTTLGRSYGGQMPSFATLTDEQVAAIATYVRQSFGNRFGPVSPSQVAAQR
jgi:cytochrome c oxidase subunit 2